MSKHTYWEIAAIKKHTNRFTSEATNTDILFRCRHCGDVKIKMVDGDWTDYADGIYENMPRPKEQP